MTLTANIVDNAYGLIAGENVSVDAKSTIYNNTALIAANKKLVINAGGNLENRDGNNFLRNNGALFGITDNVGGIVGKEGVTLSAQNVYNNNSSIIAENGPLNLLSRERWIIPARFLAVGLMPSSVRQGRSTTTMPPRTAPVISTFMRRR